MKPWFASTVDKSIIPGFTMYYQEDKSRLYPHWCVNLAFLKQNQFVQKRRRPSLSFRVGFHEQY